MVFNANSQLLIPAGLASSFLSNPRFYSVVAEGTGGEDKDRVVGSNSLDERSNSSGTNNSAISDISFKSNLCSEYNLLCNNM